VDWLFAHGNGSVGANADYTAEYGEGRVPFGIARDENLLLKLFHRSGARKDFA
jgi:hypothetical protein